MGRTLRRVVVPFLSAVAVAAAPAAAGAIPPSDLARVDRALAYVAQQQRPNGSVPAFSPVGSTADAVVSFAAAGVGRGRVHDAIGFLRRRVAHGAVSAIGLRAKVVTAWAVTGRDPHHVGGVDLVGALEGTLGVDGHYGAAAVFDQALVILALATAGETIPDDAIAWLVDAQCEDGGWQYDLPASDVDDEHCVSTMDPATDFFESETNATAVVLQAVAAAGATPAFAHDPFGFLHDIRDPVHGGWGYSWSYETTDANSTALVVQAYIASGEPIPAGGVAALRRLQYPCGAVAFTRGADGRRTGHDVGATISAVLGLLRAPGPVPAGHIGRLPLRSSCRT
jgi:hypothetical protein